MLVKKGVARRADDTSSRQRRTHSGSPPQQPAQRYERPCVGSGQQEKVSLSWVVSPGEFYCQLMATADKLAELMSAIERYYTSIGESSAETMKKPQAGAACVALFAEDSAWYRAEVVSVNANDIEVKFVDFGNTDKCQPLAIKQIKAEFMKLPVQAVLCGLKSVRPKDGEWTDAARETLEELIGEEVQCTFYACSKGKYMVDVGVTPERSVADELVSRHLAVIGSGAARGSSSSETSSTRAVRLGSPAATLPPLMRYAVAAAPPATMGDYVDCTLTHVEGPCRFYVQLSKDLAVMEALTENLNSHYSTLTEKQLKLANPTSGTACVAQYGDSSCWYRAIVQQRASPSKLDLNFVDYGHSAMIHVTRIKLLLPEFAELPPQAVQCSLTGVAADTDELTRTFKQLVSSEKDLVALVDGVDGQRLVTTLYDVSDGGEININAQLTGSGALAISRSSLAEEAHDEGEAGQADLLPVDTPRRLDEASRIDLPDDTPLRLDIAAHTDLPRDTPARLDIATHTDLPCDTPARLDIATHTDLPRDTPYGRDPATSSDEPRRLEVASDVHLPNDSFDNDDDLLARDAVESDAAYFDVAPERTEEPAERLGEADGEKERGEEAERGAGTESGVVAVETRDESRDESDEDVFHSDFGSDAESTGKNDFEVARENQDEEMEARQDETEARRDEEAEARQDETEARRDEEAEARQDETEARQDEETESRQDEETEARQDEETEARRDEETEPRRDEAAAELPDDVAAELPDDVAAELRDDVAAELPDDVAAELRDDVVAELRD
ncbi:PREDICTED: tudor domain-containing protein 1-like, partial [Priapulus caudatus]|uniref:Tudor domain-containing protein 1-like n=1 Tax=Priapulus caudatus TaxID=37621 RepID=A0ABM1EA22_PRICU